MAKTMKKSPNTVLVIDNPVKIGSEPMKSMSLGAKGRYRVLDRTTIKNAARQVRRHKQPA